MMSPYLPYQLNKNIAYEQIMPANDLTGTIAYFWQITALLRL